MTTSATAIRCVARRLGGHAAADVGLVHPPVLDQAADGDLLRAVDHDHAGHVVGAARLHQQRDGQHDHVGALGPSSASRRATSPRTAGWTMALRSASADGSENTTPASARRSDARLRPNRATRASWAGPPGATTWRATASVSTTNAPRSVSSDDTVDFPDPMPPVRPTTSIAGRPYHRPIRTEARRNRGDAKLFSSDPRTASTRRGPRASGPQGAGRAGRRLAAERPRQPQRLAPPRHHQGAGVARPDRQVAGPAPHPRHRPTRASTTPTPWASGAEIRKWSVELFRLREPRWAATEALALTTLLPAGGQPERVARAIEVFEPRLVLFLDEPSWAASRALFNGVEQMPHYITDPHRPKQVYEGFWSVRDDGVVVGKSPAAPGHPQPLPGRRHHRLPAVGADSPSAAGRTTVNCTDSRSATRGRRSRTITS